MKAIETRYAGCRFRSRLEARWAVFFDHLSIKWEYEPEGYVLDGRPYLPDFALSVGGGTTFVEVKNSELSEHEGEHVDLCRALARDTGRPALLLVGPPDIYYRMYHQFSPNQGPAQLSAAFFLDHAPKVLTADEYWFGLAELDEKTGIFRFPFNDRRAAHAFGKGLVEAIYAARSARFEHGESGAPTPPPRPVATKPAVGPIEIEQRLVGGMFLGGELNWGEALRPGDFERPAHGYLLQAMNDLRASGQPTDAVAVADHLRGKGDLDRCGGPNYLIHLLEVGDDATVDADAMTVIERAKRQRWSS